MTRTDYIDRLMCRRAIFLISMIFSGREVTPQPTPSAKEYVSINSVRKIAQRVGFIFVYLGTFQGARSAHRTASRAPRPPRPSGKIRVRGPRGPLEDWDYKGAVLRVLAAKENYIGLRIEKILCAPSPGGA